MSYTAMAWARAIKTGSATIKSVLLAVANYADEEGICWPSQDQLAEDTELSRHSIMRALDQLEEMGLLDRERRHRGDGSRTSDLIMLDLSRTVLRSTEQRSSEQRSTQQQPKSHGATAEPIIEPLINKNRRARPKTDLPEDWQPDAKTWALADALGFTSQEAWDQLERMRDWAKNADGDKGRKSDWNAAFRNWLKRAADDRHGRRDRTSTPSKPTLREGFDILDAVFDEAIRRADGQGEERREENPVGVPGLRKSAA